MIWPSVLAAFLASLVECVEALTIVLVVGATINWRTSLLGALAALGTLAALVAVFGSAIVQLVPIDVLRLVIGIFLILFGLQWLLKAVLRYSGLKALHDEAAIFQRERESLTKQGQASGSRVDTLGFLTSFKAVLLEGLEVAFIVVTFGTSAATTEAEKLAGVLQASFGAALACLAVIILGLFIRKPLTKIPENSLKFAVGVMLVSFGCFWTGEGFGYEWPLGDLIIVVIAAILVAYCLGLVWLLRKRRAV